MCGRVQFPWVSVAFAEHKAWAHITARAKAGKIPGKTQLTRKTYYIVCNRVIVTRRENPDELQV